jgi:hypothetical protein
MAYLFRVKRYVEDSMMLLFILTLFLMDSLGVQHLFGWVGTDGIRSVWIGGISGVLLCAGAFFALQLPLGNRLFVSAVGVIVFIRFGAFLIVQSSLPGGNVQLPPRHVGLSWVLAACLLPFFFPRLKGGPAEIPARKLERWGLAVCTTFAVAHFLVIGNSLALPFRVAYLTPFLILLPAALEQVAPKLRSIRWLRMDLDLLPYLGLAFASTQFEPSLFETFWSKRFPITQFWLCLLLAVPVMIWRARRLRQPGRFYEAAALAVMAVLGWDFSEVLTRLRYPETWQLVPIVVICWTTILLLRRFKAGLLLHTMAAFVVAAYLEREYGYSIILAFLMLLAWGWLIQERLCRTSFPLIFRFVLLVTVAFVPAYTLFGEHGNLLNLSVAASACAGLFILGWFWREKFLYFKAAASGITSASVAFVSLQYEGDLSLGRLMIELGFLILLFSLLSAILGDTLKKHFERLWLEIKGQFARSRPKKVVPGD